MDATVTSDTTVLYQKKSRGCCVRLAYTAFGYERRLLATSVAVNYDFFSESGPRRRPLQSLWFVILRG